ncbi:hypothetical protein DERF_005651 [Dermatophagoides farinae]|uniref:Uncharacterized protein n=1 Tax=Dermatophagoides farinae TaxID=6954 RepID=A0A922I5T7_DERFA|nr:hypothetical protein DERF_005651 [Dermatophagoides farinae]
MGCTTSTQLMQNNNGDKRTISDIGCPSTNQTDHINDNFGGFGGDDKSIIKEPNESMKSDVATIGTANTLIANDDDEIIMNSSSSIMSFDINDNNDDDGHSSCTSIYHHHKHPSPYIHKQLANIQQPPPSSATTSTIFELDPNDDMDDRASTRPLMSINDLQQATAAAIAAEHREQKKCSTKHKV